MKNFTLLKNLFFVCVLSGLLACSDDTQEDKHKHDEEYTHNEQEEHNGEREHDDTEESSVKLSKQLAKELGIKTTRVETRTLHSTISAYGEMTTGSDQLSHVRARFPGLVQTVKANIGDSVKRGDLLTSVESNDSLRSYQIKAPISGTIIQRHANTGEYTGDQILFSIANLNTLWAEFRIYPAQSSLIQEGQKVSIFLKENTESNNTERKFSADIKHIVPVADKPYQLARVEYSNIEQLLVPGMLVEGKIQVGEYKVLASVRRSAVQNIEGKEGVFVVIENTYTFVPVKLGRSDDDFYEVLSGLSIGQEYVSENSYLIKADIEKSTAEHQH